MTVTPDYATETYQQAIERTLGHPVQIYGCPNSDTYGIRELLPSGCENHYTVYGSGLDHARLDYYPDAAWALPRDQLPMSFFIHQFAPSDDLLSTR